MFLHTFAGKRKSKTHCKHFTKIVVLWGQHIQALPSKGPEAGKLELAEHLVGACSGSSLRQGTEAPSCRPDLLPREVCCLPGTRIRTLWKGCCRLWPSPALPHRHQWWCQGQSGKHQALTTLLWGMMEEWGECQRHGSSGSFHLSPSRKGCEEE